MPSPDLCTQPRHTALPRLSARLFQHWLKLFRAAAAGALPHEAMCDRASDLAARIADSLWYGYRLSRRTQPAAGAL